jgi:glycosyltransferase involved in cell wall biosynthesis
MAVVVTSRAEPEVLSACLATLEECCQDADAELYVVRAGTADELHGVIRRFPFATYVLASPGTRTAALRRIGLLQSTRNIVVFVDDRVPERVAWTAMQCRSWPAWIENGGRLPADADGASPSPGRPVLSVVIPAHNAAETLASALDALMLTDLPRESWELVIVDDASDDDTALVASEHADRLIRLPGHRHGPGYARNRGFEITLGDIAAFVDADVMVRPDTLRRAATLLMSNPRVDAVFGTYDAPPATTGFVSQYRNLLLHYYNRRAIGDSSTFHSGCGVIRGAVFEETGGFDEWHFARHQLEDLELGRRLAGLGYRIVLNPYIHATHLKRWTLRGMIVSEIVDHAVPWMRIVDRLLSPARNAARSLRATKKRNIALTWLAAVLLGFGLPERNIAALLGSMACLVLVVINNRDQLAFFRQERGLAFAIATIPMDILYYFISGLGVGAGWLTKEMLGEPRPGPAAEAFTEMAVKRWPPVPVKRTIDRRETLRDTKERGASVISFPVTPPVDLLSLNRVDPMPTSRPPDQSAD